jgi:hypothetical protein
MGGDLIAEESRGGGARFVLTLPIADYDDSIPVTHTEETRAVRR